MSDVRLMVGGRYYTAASVEITRWIGENWGLATFVDTGNAADSLHDFDLAWGYGVGGRFRTPIGPFRVDVAYGQQSSSVRVTPLLVVSSSAGSGFFATFGNVARTLPTAEVRQGGSRWVRRRPSRATGPTAPATWRCPSRGRSPASWGAARATPRAARRGPPRRLGGGSWAREARSRIERTGILPWNGVRCRPRRARRPASSSGTLCGARVDGPEGAQ